MKNTIKYITLLSIGLLACEPEFDQPVEDTPAAAQESGDADFSTFVALGDSLTAGFADGALYIDGQNNSFANMMATQMQAAGGGTFTTPLMADNFGGFAEAAEAFPVRLVLDAVNLAPIRVQASSTTSIANVLTGPFNNMGIPGAKSFHLGFDGYGTLNPYFGRFASSPGTNVVLDALTQTPTFFNLWIGSNDVLSYATSGGTGVNQLGNENPLTYGSNDISDPDFFATTYNGIVGALAGPVTAGGAGAKGLLVNIPSINVLPFFTTVPNNALVLDAEQAASLTGFFQAYSAIFAGGATQNLVGLGLDLETASATANALAAQYAFTFTEGANRFLIATEVTQTNPQGIRQMTSSELLLLTIDQNALRNEGYGSVATTDEVLAVLGKLQTGGTPTAEEAGLVLAAVNPILDEDTLDDAEQAEIETATAAFNTVIENAATTFDLALYNAASRLEDLSTDGISANGSFVTNEFATGGFFSLDGIHLSPKGNGITANEMIEVINNKYGSTLESVQTRDLPGVYIQ